MDRRTQPRPTGIQAVTEEKLERLAEACRPLPRLPCGYEQRDYLTNVLLTVLDLQMRNEGADQRAN